MRRKSNLPQRLSTQVLKDYMTCIYKWHGNFDPSNGMEEINYHPLVCALKAEIYAELKAKKLSENIISETIIMDD
jgi:hypothetical protein